MIFSPAYPVAARPRYLALVNQGWGDTCSYVCKVSYGGDIKPFTGELVKTSALFCRYHGRVLVFTAAPTGCCLS